MCELFFLISRAADSAADDSSEIDKSEKKIQYECVVEMGEDGPLFSVTPVGAKSACATCVRVL